MRLLLFETRPLTYLFIALLVCVQTCGCFIKKRIPYSEIYTCKSILKTSEKDKNYDWHLVVISSGKCGFCLRAKKDIHKYDMPSSFKVTFLEHDITVVEYEEFLKEGWYKNCEVIQTDGWKNFSKFFPIFLLYRMSDQKLVYTEKGYDKLTMNNIKSIVKKSSMKKRDLE